MRRADRPARASRCFLHLCGSIGALMLMTVSDLAAQTSINVTNNYAYSGNVGWVDCRGDITNGAVIGEHVCSNYVYAANVGWLHMGSGNPTNGFRYGNDSPSDYGVNHDGAGNLSGYAWGANVGWISFATNGTPRVDLLTGELSGHAWGANVGWISLSNAEAYVQTDSMSSGEDSDGDGIPDMWEYAEAGNLTDLSDTNDFDGDGVLDVDEYAADTDPADSGSYIRITQISMTNATNAVVTWTAEQTRLYRVDFNDDLENLAGWNASGLGMQYADPGPTTTRTVTDSATDQNFFRVRVVRPLQ